MRSAPLLRFLLLLPLVFCFATSAFASGKFVDRRLATTALLSFALPRSAGSCSALFRARLLLWFALSSAHCCTAPPRIPRHNRPTILSWCEIRGSKERN